MLLVGAQGRLVSGNMTLLPIVRSDTVEVPAKRTICKVSALLAFRSIHEDKLNAALKIQLSDVLRYQKYAFMILNTSSPCHPHATSFSPN